MEENDTHHLNRAPLNHNLLPEIAPVVSYAPQVNIRHIML